MISEFDSSQDLLSLQSILDQVKSGIPKMTSHFAATKSFAHFLMHHNNFIKFGFCFRFHMTFPFNSYKKLCIYRI